MKLSHRSISKRVDQSTPHQTTQTSLSRSELNFRDTPDSVAIEATIDGRLQLSTLCSPTGARTQTLDTGGQEVRGAVAYRRENAGDGRGTLEMAGRRHCRWPRHQVRLPGCAAAGVLCALLRLGFLLLGIDKLYSLRAKGHNI
jgi:hypothetical protein